MRIVTATTDITRIPELPDPPFFIEPWHVVRIPNLYRTPQDEQGNYLYDEQYVSVPAETYFSRLDSVGMIWIWHPVKNTLRCI
jgi:hypothetical protein